MHFFSRIFRTWKKAARPRHGLLSWHLHADLHVNLAPDMYYFVYDNRQKAGGGGECLVKRTSLTFPSSRGRSSILVQVGVVDEMWG